MRAYIIARKAGASVLQHASVEAQLSAALQAEMDKRSKAFWGEDNPADTVGKAPVELKVKLKLSTGEKAEK